MIRLVIYTDTKDYELDTYGDENISITYAIDDLTNLENKSGNYSKTFDLPATKNNNDFFGHLYDLQSDISQFNTLKGHKCELFSNNISIFEGLLYLNEIVKVKSETKYKVNLIGETIRFLETIGDATIRDLNFDELDHDFSSTALNNSLVGLGVPLSSGGSTLDLAYTLINNTGISSTGGGDFTYIATQNLQPFIRLYYLLEKIFDYAGFEIESDFINTNNTEFNHIYMDTGLNDKRILGGFGSAFRHTSQADADKINEPQVSGLSEAITPQTVFYNFAGANGILFTQNIPITDCFLVSAPGFSFTDFTFKNIHHITTSYTEIPFTKEPLISPINGQGNDGGNILGTNGALTIPVDNSFFDIDIKLSIWATPGITIDVLGEKTTPAGTTTSVVIGSMTMLASTTGVFFNNNGNQEQDMVYQTMNISTTLSGDQNDVYKFKIKKSGGDAHLSQHEHVFTSQFIDTNNFNDPDFPPPSGMSTALSQYLHAGNPQFHRGNSNTFCIDTFMPMTHSLSNQYANTLHVEDATVTEVIMTTRLHENHGDVKLADIIKDVFKMFNLVCEQKGTKLKIEPFNAFMLTGAVKDWTDKIDTTQILQNYEGLPSKIIFKYNNDTEDYCLNTYKAQTGDDYGSMTVELPVDHINEIEINLDVFSATAFKRLSSGLIYSCCYAYNEGVYEKFNNKPRLLFKPTQYNGIIFATGDDINNVYEASYYRAFTHYEDLLSNLSTNSFDLNYGYTQGIFIAQNYTQPINNLYNLYWFDYIQQNYTKDRVLVKAKIYLTESDIQKFSFADTIIIKNQHYKVVKIDYNAGQTGLARVELLKI